MAENERKPMTHLDRSRVAIPAFIAALLVAAVLGVLRFTLPAPGIDVGDIFKDLSHLFVGGLFGMSAAFKLCGERQSAHGYFCLAVGLSFLEIAAFFRH